MHGLAFYVKEGPPFARDLSLSPENSADSYLCFRLGVLHSVFFPLLITFNFFTRIPDFGCHSPALLDFFIYFDASICSTMAFPPLENSDHVFVSISIDFSKGYDPFHRIADAYD